MVVDYPGTAIVNLDTVQCTAYPSSQAAASPLKGSSEYQSFYLFSLT